MKKNCVYVMANASRSVLYIGVTSDLWRRRIEHRHEKEDEGFCGKYQVHDVIYVEWIADMRDAINRKKYLKGKSRAKKLALIQEANPHLDTLAPPFFNLPKR